MTSTFNTSGVVIIEHPEKRHGDRHEPMRWGFLDSFTQGAIKAALKPGKKIIPGTEPGFADLAGETLKRLIADCAEAQTKIWGFGGDEKWGLDYWMRRQNQELYHIGQGPLVTFLGADDGKVYLKEGA
jgi:hypothetical protein